MDENETSSRLDEILVDLSNQQMRFIVEMPNHSSKKSCAEALGLLAQSVYNWGPEVDEAIELIHRDIVSGALAIRKKNLIKAMMIKMAGLDLEDNDGLVQKVATEIIEWETGKAQQKIDHTSDGEKIGVVGLGIDTDKV